MKSSATHTQTHTNLENTELSDTKYQLYYSLSVFCDENELTTCPSLSIVCVKMKCIELNLSIYFSFVKSLSEIIHKLNTKSTLSPLQGQ